MATAYKTIQGVQCISTDWHNTKTAAYAFATPVPEHQSVIESIEKWNESGLVSHVMVFSFYYQQFKRTFNTEVARTRALLRTEICIKRMMENLSL